MNNLAGGAWRGLEESWGLWENFYFSFYFHPISLFSFTWELGSGWACLDQFLADQVEREETNWMKVKVLSPKSFCCSLLLSVLDTVLLTKVLANKTEKIFPASECSKDLLESLSKIIKFLF